MSIHSKSRKTNRWIDILFIVTIILLTSLMAFLLLVPKSEKLPKSVATSNESESVYPGIRIMTETSNDINAPYSIQYPQSNVISFNEKVNTYTRKVKAIYLEETKIMSEKDKHHKGELNISFELFQHPSGYYSFLIHSKMYTGGANGINETKIFRLHYKSGHLLTIQDLLGNNQKALNTLSTKVQETILADSVLNSDVKQKTAPIWSNYANFVLTKKSVDFFFDNEPRVISFPLVEINDLLAKEFQFPVVSVTPQPPKEVPLEDKSVPDGNSEKETPVSINNKVVALTFDDGPNPDSTKRILETLQKYHAKATFFMLGSRVSFYPEIVKEMKDAGHELGNHTWNHPNLTKASPQKIALEINNTSDAIEKVTGSRPTVFRPPYGAVNQKVRNQTTLPIILWDVDTLDWKYRDSKHLLEHVKHNVKDRSTVLMHDIHGTTADGLDDVLAYLQKEGFIFITVSEMSVIKSKSGL